IVFDDKQTVVLRAGVMERDAAGHLHPHCGFARAFFAENDRSRRVGWIAVDLVPGRVISEVAATVFEYRVRLGIFLGKRIDRDAVVLEELLNAHWQAYFGGEKWGP